MDYQNTVKKAPDIKPQKKLAGLKFAYSTSAEEFNKQCNKLIAEGFHPVKPVAVNVKKLVPQYVEVFAKYTDDLSIYPSAEILMQYVEESRFICEYSVEKFNSATEAAIKEGLISVTEPKAMIDESKDCYYFICHFVKVSSVIKTLVN